MAIQFLLALNRQGKTRVSKWYVNASDEEKWKTESQVHKLICSRDHKNQSNFVQFQSRKLVYKRYAGLFFCFCIDVQDNELSYLESIRLLVEVLDSYFNNVCELDLVFNFYKVSEVIDEMFLSGEIEETSKDVILQRVQETAKLD
ncbi:unnamed protein product [Kuraishia capsulata CBS 1993]|uniref:AP complex subunit sigma n=1 Tax=Kuraishia capsulata CBS 1993 TaxID=1382522 RepID=W6MJJ4_9ASCO|nr:uncharacterized protein KUCA_T00002683001 [Kuraishia capsulata CBS 1993]CDK26709.1 unnamed protein product [Kuraishia capsulata CBS 1993]